MKQLWMRLGDASDYDKVDDPYTAGYDVGVHYGGKPEPNIRWTTKGVVVEPGFEGYNYISLFWGDDDAQPVGKASLTVPERKEFKRGLYEGADFTMPAREKMLSGVPKACWVGRNFSRESLEEARRQLPIWKADVGHNIGADCTVHLSKTTSGYAIVICGPDYTTSKKRSRRLVKRTRGRSSPASLGGLR